MLLRRITHHVNEQNWFAVFLDFFIVVAGILIAFQVTTWNEERLDRVDSALILERLNDDFTYIRAATESGKKMHAENVAAAARLIDGVRSKQFDEVHLHLDLLNVTDFSTPSQTSSTYSELVASGRLRLIGNDDLLQALKKYDNYVKIVNDNYGVFVDRLRTTNNALLSVQTLKISKTPTLEFANQASQILSVDRDLLLNDPDIYTLLQNAYAVQNNIHVIFHQNQIRISEIIKMIEVEQGK